MIITCPDCGSKFQLEEKQLPEGGSQVRCSLCQHVFFVPQPAVSEESFYEPQEFPIEIDESDVPPSYAPHRSSRWKWVLLILLLAILAIGAIFRYGGADIWKGDFEPMARRFSALGTYFGEKVTALANKVPSLSFLKKYLGIQEEAQGYIGLEKLRGYYLDNTHLHLIFVVEGQAVNHFKESRSFIQVRGSLLDEKGNRVQEKTVYCGNILSEKDLKEMPREPILKSLSSQFGISFSNVNIQPQKSVPFMIVFTELSAANSGDRPGQPPGAKTPALRPSLSDFSVEVVSSQKGTK
jgi:predicted Zn finger-like uncharacterized protein